MAYRVLTGPTRVPNLCVVTTRLGPNRVAYFIWGQGTQSQILPGAAQPWWAALALATLGKSEYGVPHMYCSLVS